MLDRGRLSIHVGGQGTELSVHCKYSQQQQTKFVVECRVQGNVGAIAIIKHLGAVVVDMGPQSELVVMQMDSKYVLKKATIVKVKT